MGRYRIKAVARMTGFRPELLRRWEQRYGLFAPPRAGNRYREYDEEDVRLLLYIKAQLAQGRAIGELAAEGREALLRRLAASPAASKAAALVEELVGYLLALQKSQFDARLRECAALYPFAELVTEVLVPLVQRLGALRQAGQASLGSERLAVVAVKSRLLAMLQATAPGRAAPLLLCACPAGEVHELGLLAFACLAQQAGWEACYLGADVPLAELLAVCRHLQPALVALSCTRVDSAARYGALVQELDVHLASQYPTLLGGQAVARWRPPEGLRYLRLCPSLAEAREILAGTPTENPLPESRQRSCALPCRKDA
ncbi:MAG: hypothetical protein KatS3mg131_2561 [Candidatus Tectimicrobiota bacterium]|nr:MAG: hypothetical protein KatS3mg131_2561 [Candidatus Tectomicrobia bacterium]